MLNTSKEKKASNLKHQIPNKTNSKTKKSSTIKIQTLNLLFSEILVVIK
tara:strand:- start:532 stop:678 length:147 start_codon:yes stop_codon:yes gene_type:complete